MMRLRPYGNPAYATDYYLDRDRVQTTLPSGRAIDGAYDTGGGSFSGSSCQLLLDRDVY